MLDIKLSVKKGKQVSNFNNNLFSGISSGCKSIKMISDGDIAFLSISNTRYTTKFYIIKRKLYGRLEIRNYAALTN